MDSSLPFAHRKYLHSKYSESEDNFFENTNKSDVDAESICKLIRESIIGESTAHFNGPYGERRIVYADYTASARSLTFIEDFLKEEVLPYYGNTHTVTSFCGKQTTYLREESRALIKRLVNGQNKKGAEKDVLIFTGNGSTGAIHKMVSLLFGTWLENNSKDKPVVFVGPFEHHSNILPWREAGAEIVFIQDSNGSIDIKHLESEISLKKNEGKSKLIGSFSAASNVTGIIIDDEKINMICKLMHSYGGLAFWDYASAGPYVKIDMNPESGIYKDAIFLSTHKFIGGVGCPGILVAKKKLFQARKTSTSPGGGTVFFVTEKDHRYVKEIEQREEGGTPDIIGSIRAGLVFQLKNTIGENYIRDKELDICSKAISKLQHPNIYILGTPQSKHKLPIISLMIRVPNTSLFLHYNFVATLLNDLFGIQVRGGCACAGVYGQKLLGIDFQLAKEFESRLVEDDDNEFLRPGFLRVSLAYFMSQELLNFIIEAILFVAEEGFKFLPFYTFFPDTGEWVHLKQKKFPHKSWLGNMTYQRDKAVFNPYKQFEVQKITKDADLSTYLQQARDLVQETTKIAKSESTDQNHLFDENTRKLKWFLLPSEASQILRDKSFIQTLNQSPYSLIFKDSIPKQENETKNNNNEEKQPVDDDDILFADLDGLEQEDKKEQVVKQLEIPKKEILAPTQKAMKDYDMVKDGDKILVAVSGGKDSLSLLHTLLYLKSRLPFKFQIGACTVDPQTDAYDPSPLRAYMKQLGVPYFFESQGIVARARDACPTSICSWCSRMKRGAIYACARREGYNVIALGQHLDDLAESFIMSAFHNGFLRTMKANYFVKDGDLRVIRPLIYVRERDLRDFAINKKLPVIAENCPACFQIPKERQRTKTLLSNQEHLFPSLYSNLLSTMKPLIDAQFEKMKK